MRKTGEIRYKQDRGSKVYQMEKQPELKPGVRGSKVYSGNSKQLHINSRQRPGE